MFAANLHETGPVEIIPPNGADVKYLTYVFANGVRFYHGGGKGDLFEIRLNDGEVRTSGQQRRTKPRRSRRMWRWPCWKWMDRSVC